MLLSIVSDPQQSGVTVGVGAIVAPALRSSINVGIRRSDVGVATVFVANDDEIICASKRWARGHQK